MGQNLDRTRQDATRSCHCSRFGNLKLSESSSCPTVIYFIDNSVCSLLRKLAGSDTSELGLVMEDQENADLAWYFQYVTTHNRATTPIKANASHSAYTVQAVLRQIIQISNLSYSDKALNELVYLLLGWVHNQKEPLRSRTPHWPAPPPRSPCHSSPPRSGLRSSSPGCWRLPPSSHRPPGSGRSRSRWPARPWSA